MKATQQRDTQVININDYYASREFNRRALSFSSSYDKLCRKFTNSDIVEVKDENGNVKWTSQLKTREDAIEELKEARKRGYLDEDILYKVELKDTDEILGDILKGLLERSKLNDITAYFECIQSAVLSLHANKYHAVGYNGKLDLVSPYKEQSELEKEKAYQQLSSYFIERAMLTHNCLCHCSIKSEFKISLVQIRDANDEGWAEFIHAYNVVTDEEGKHYIFDSSFPGATIEKGYNFNVLTIDDETYSGIINDDCAVEVRHYGILTLPEYSIIYNSNQGNLKRDTRPDPEAKRHVLEIRSA